MERDIEVHRLDLIVNFLRGDRFRIAQEYLQDYGAVMCAAFSVRRGISRAEVKVDQAARVRIAKLLADLQERARMQAQAPNVKPE